MKLTQAEAGSALSPVPGSGVLFTCPPVQYPEGVFRNLGPCPVAQKAPLPSSAGLSIRVRLEHRQTEPSLGCPVPTSSAPAKTLPHLGAT